MDGDGHGFYRRQQSKRRGATNEREQAERILPQRAQSGAEILDRKISDRKMRNGKWDLGRRFEDRQTDRE